jgi:hypothetical protein
MRFQRRFSKGWEPTVLADRVLAEGTWWYQGVDKHSVRLLQRAWDYSSADIDAIEIAVAGTVNDDYIDYAISDSGDVFFWELRAQESCTTSTHFSSYEAARNHFSTYAGPSQIRWYVER